jgi:hypothetical protein
MDELSSLDFPAVDLDFILEATASSEVSASRVSSEL